MGGYYGAKLWCREKHWGSDNSPITLVVTIRLSLGVMTIRLSFVAVTIRLSHVVVTIRLSLVVVTIRLSLAEVTIRLSLYNCDPSVTGAIGWSGSKPPVGMIFFSFFLSFFLSFFQSCNH